jgi:flavin reductase (DIM6/NTAB) family NADH-FMN oxidoreductase RutF
MFYEPGKTPSGLPLNPFKSCCVPRPIGWISTVGADGAHNLAPFSQFQNVAYDPPMVMVSANRRQDGTLKDTIRNIMATGEFVWSMATYAQREQVAASAQEFAPGVDEFEAVGIAHLPAQRVKARRVAGSPAHFECRSRQVIDLPGNTPEAHTHLVIAEVIAIHLDDAYITADGRFDVLRARPLARMGYLDYTSVESVFEMQVPDFRVGQVIEFLTDPAQAPRTG